MTGFMVARRLSILYILDPWFCHGFIYIFVMIDKEGWKNQGGDGLFTCDGWLLARKGVVLHGTQPPGAGTSGVRSAPGSTRIIYQSWQRSLPPFGGDLTIDKSIFLHVKKDW